MKNLPFPRTVSGWLLSFALIVVSFFLYYGFYFGKLNSKYYDNKLIPGLQSTNLDNVTIEVQIPKAISHFGARELIVTIVVKNDIEHAKLFVSENNSLVLFCPKAPTIFSGCEESRNLLEFNSLKSGERRTKIIWIMVAPRVLSKEDEVQYNFSFNDTPVSFGAGAQTISKIDDVLTLGHFGLSTLLLPPWSNGVIPAFVLLFIYFFEHKIQPGQKFRNKVFWQQNESDDEKTSDEGKSVKSIWRRHRIQLWAFLAVSFLYFSLGGLLYGLVQTEPIWMLVWIVASVLAFTILWVFISIAFANTDIKEDPLYKKESVKSEPSPFEKQISATLTQMNETLKNISASNKELSNELVEKLEDLVTRCCDNYDKQKSSQQENILQELVPAIQKIGNLLENRQPEPPKRSPLDIPYNHISLLIDDGLVRLFKEELPNFSHEQFQAKLNEPGFALCILSLFERANEQKWDDTCLIGDMSLMRWIQESVFWQDNPQTGQVVFARWLSEVPKNDENTAIITLMRWMFKFKTDQVGKYLFDLLPQVCSPQTVVILLADYLDVYQKEGRNTDIQWNKVLEYFLRPNTHTEPLMAEAAISKTWYPFTDNPETSLWNFVSLEKPFSVEDWKSVYTGLLKWLCIIPTDPAQRLAKEIYEFYREDQMLKPSSPLAKFVKIGYPTREKITQWCNKKR